MKRKILLIILLIVWAVWASLFLQKNYSPPILMYHHVGSTRPEVASTNVSTRAFERQMEYLKVHRYNVLPLSTFLGKVKSGKKLPPRTIAITFDDGGLDNFKNAFPLLKKMRFPATIFMITDNLNKKDWLSDEDIKILNSSGIEIGSHTVNHAFLPNLSEKEVQFEIIESKKTLERLLNHPITLFSYPAGGVTKKVREAVIRAGYEAAVTTNYGAKGKKDPYAYTRIKISESSSNLFNFWIKTSGFYHLGKKRIPIR